MLLRLTLAIREKKLQNYLEKRLSLPDVRVESVGHLDNVWQRLTRSCGDVLVSSRDFLLEPVDNGIMLLNNLPENPTTVIMDNDDSPETLAYLTASGADLALYSGISKKNLAETLEATIESRKQFFKSQHLIRRSISTAALDDFVLESERMQIFVGEVRQVLASDAPILILGETGVGKEHLARAIHAEGPRSAGPFIAVNAAAVPEQLLESELFGHEQGSFTGATRYHRGAFELAHGGTIFLDEIGEMPLALQSKILRVLQDFEVKPVGGEQSISLDVRVIAATSRDIEEEISRNNFRKDLYYRLSVLVFTVPPLRDRKEDIPALARRFVNKYRHKLGRGTPRLSLDAVSALNGYDWPGNVRELMNVIERALILSQSDEITGNDLPNTIQNRETPSSPFLSPGSTVMPDWEGKTLHAVKREAFSQIEKIYLDMVLKKTGGRIDRAAKIAGIHPRGLYDKMKRLNLKKETYKAGYAEFLKDDPHDK